MWVATSQANQAAKHQVVFEEHTWKETWEPMMRADFKLFDEFPGLWWFFWLGGSNLFRCGPNTLKFLAH